jgi:hypothetical protein
MAGWFNDLIAFDYFLLLLLQVTHSVKAREWKPIALELLSYVLFFEDQDYWFSFLM